MRAYARHRFGTRPSGGGGLAFEVGNGARPLARRLARSCAVFPGRNNRMAYASEPSSTFSPLGDLRAGAGFGLLGNRDCVALSSRPLGGHAGMTSSLATTLRPTKQPPPGRVGIRAADALDPRTFLGIRRRAVL